MDKDEIKMNLSEELNIKRSLINGFTYYVRKVDYFEKFITMSLTIKIGSIHENKNENGLAHLLEHMHMSFHKFNLYPHIRYKAEAYTDFFETIFYIKCFNDWENIYTCLEIFNFIARGRFLSELYFINTKNDVISEIIDYMKYKQEENRLFSLLLNGSQYLDFLAIGDVKDVSNLSYEQLVQFYNTWYSGDLMSIAIVGDIKDINKLENNIKSVFEGISNRKLPMNYFNHDIPKYNNIKIHEIEIQEIKKNDLEIYFKVKKSEIISLNAIDIEVMEAILFKAVEHKLKSFFEDLNIKVIEITCENVNLDMFHMFYVIKIDFKESKHIVMKDIVDLINTFFKSITIYMDNLFISTIRMELSNNIDKRNYDYYDFVGMHSLLLECIDDYILGKPVYISSEKCKLLKNSIKKMPLDNIHNYLKYWINQCDRLYVARVYKNYPTISNKQ